MKWVENKKFISKIARLYYLGNLTQQEIADNLNISRTKVSRCLDKAREEKIVEIKINSPQEDYTDLEYEIEERYKLKECIIVPTYDRREDILRDMADKLADMFNRIIKDGDYFGIGWGTSLKSIADYLNLRMKVDIKVVPLIGGIGKVGTGIHTNSVARTLANKFGGVSYMINSPAILDSSEAKEIIQNDSNAREIIKMSGRVSTAMVGMSDIGPQSTLIKNGNFKVKEFNYLNSLGVVGDVNLIFIDENGKYIQNEINKRIITTSIERIEKIENVIGIGFGGRKLKVILGALRGRIINILLTDETTAKSIISSN
jgi:DNA-binding transcriptional regulator LsrR (DeoR family)